METKEHIQPCPFCGENEFSFFSAQLVLANSTPTHHVAVLSDEKRLPVDTVICKQCGNIQFKFKRVEAIAHFEENK